jgi:hypothetical protein
MVLSPSAKKAYVERDLTGADSMRRLDYFSGASERWRVDAKVRARRVIVEHAEDPLGYVRKRLDRSRFGTFERRRWTFIQKVLLELAEEQTRRPEPLSPA